MNRSKTERKNFQLKPRTLFEVFLQRLLGFPSPVKNVAYRKLKRRYAQRTEKMFENIVSTLTSDDIVIDLGANVGTYTEVLAKTGAKVIAYEPDPYAYNRLEAVAKNYPNVITYKKAVTHNAELVDFESSVLTENGRTIQSAKASKIIPTTIKNIKSPKIFTTSFSDVIEKHNYIKLIKCDIEGSELDILKNITESQLKKIEHIFVETHERLYPETLDEILSLTKHFETIADTNVNLYWK